MKLFVCTIGFTFGGLMTACDAPTDDDSERQAFVVFEGAAVNQALEDDPSTVHLIDLADGVTYYLDGRTEAFDISSFQFICPSMDFPIPFEDAADPRLGPEITGLWGLRLPDPNGSEDSFRLADDDNDGCPALVCPGNSDCYDMCEFDPEDDPL